MLVVTNLCKTYGKDQDAVETIRDMSLRIERGQFVCVVGPSGAGKTTLLRCLTGLLPVSGGSVRLNDAEVTSPPAEMAVVFQDYSRSLMPWLTVATNVGLPLRNKIRDSRVRRARVEEALEQVGLGGFGSRYPWQLSGGMQQRVAIARGLAYQPEILLMDEPYASVDAQTRADLEDLILRIRAEAGLTVVLVTHDIDEAVYLADRVVVLSKRPATVLRDITVDLPLPRDQVATKSLARFAELRSTVFQLIRGGDRSFEDPAEFAVGQTQR
ncbi:ABC transporter ATP-binding protein [Phytohabitans kaempferiae]|uniref:ABC transporter ATP-binding protein n=1 Tax=Phytohabitans kaempferiae TaxID=1620943 RepID=A0ABV6LYW2_9ACTN